MRKYEGIIKLIFKLLAGFYDLFDMPFRLNRYDKPRLALAKKSPIPAYTSWIYVSEPPCTFMYFCCLVIFTLILSFANPAFASENQFTAPATDVNALDAKPQTDTPKETALEFNKGYFHGGLADFTNIVTSPARWDAPDWSTAALVTGTAAGLYFNDNKIKTWVQRNKNTTTADIVLNGRRVGAVTLPALGAFYLYGYFSDNVKAQKTVLLSIESLAITGVFVQALKFATHRHRPYTGDAYNTWDGPSFDNTGGHLAFPSGDASSAFAVATVIASEYDDTVLVPSLAYGAATVIALGRVHDNAHWSSDAFVASAIGYFTGKAVVVYHRNGGEQKLSLAPLVEGSNRGLVLTYGF